MKREMLTGELLARSLRNLRSLAHLTQREIAERASRFNDFGFGRLLESQISDFERGKTLPSLGSLFNLLAACSDDAETVDLNILQRAIAIELDTEDEVRRVDAKIAATKEGRRLSGVASNNGSNSSANVDSESVMFTLRTLSIRLDHISLQLERVANRLDQASFRIERIEKRQSPWMESTAS